ncbi:MAG: hypothetical protein ABSA75_11455 [Candidatus Bathyarchaeia archaeon]|jgi:hypothetical protein
MTQGNDSRLRKFLRNLGLIIVALIGFLSGAAVLFRFIPLQVWTIFFGICVIGAFLFLWKSTKPVHLPEETIIESENSDDPVYLEVPMPHHMLLAANKHAMTIYGHSALELAKVEPWYNVNPYIGAVLRSRNGEYLGYFDILPLEEEAAKQLVSGQLSEKDILPKHILGPQKMKNAKTLYFAGIAAKDAGTEIGKCRASELFLGVVEYMRFYYGDAPRQVLAIAATPSGERVLKGINAQVVCAAPARKDKCNLYEKIYTSDVLEGFKRRASKRGELDKTKFSPIPTAE